MASVQEVTPQQQLNTGPSAPRAIKDKMKKRSEKVFNVQFTETTAVMQGKAQKVTMLSSCVDLQWELMFQAEYMQDGSSSVN